MRLVQVVVCVAVAVVLTLGPASAEAAKKEVSLYAVEHFSSLTEAQKSCGSDTVVWANLRTRVYHLDGSRWFGKTKKGAYFCKSAVEKAGVHASKE